MFKRCFAIYLFLLAFVSKSFGIENSSVILNGSITLCPVSPSKEVCQETRIQPGTALKTIILIENSGCSASPSGEIFVRFGLAPPLNDQPGSVLFESEKKQLPSILPGKSIEITFETSHQTPTIIDFIHYDWLMREYEAIALFEGQEKVIGTLSLTVSAYYYPAAKKEYPSKLKSGHLEESTPPSF